jgi:hypothetical protein
MTHLNYDLARVLIRDTSPKVKARELMMKVVREWTTVVFTATHEKDVAFLLFAFAKSA